MILYAGEIDVFTLEHGLRKVHTTHRLHECTDFMKVVREEIDKKNARILTIIFWGHGNRADEKTGYLKIFPKTGGFNCLFIDDILRGLRTLAESKKCKIQFLMTQCWAHCHESNIHEDSDELTVDWFTSEAMPETSARRWDSPDAGSEMDQNEFDSFNSEIENYEKIELSTKLKYKDETTQRVFLKYLQYASVHIEATKYIFLQRTIR